MDVEKIIVNCFSLYTREELRLTPDFIKLFTVKNYKKGQLFIRSNTPWLQFSIVHQGMFRLFYLSQDGKEHTKGFFLENQILAPHAPSAINKVVNFAIESSEDSQILTANYQSVRIYLESKKWGKSIIINMLESMLNEKVEREYSWLNLDAESRYINFKQQNKMLTDRLPLYIIASYLGMTDVTLSRIRKKLNT